MRQIQVLLNAFGHGYSDVHSSVRLAVRQAATVNVCGTTDEVMRRLNEEFGDRVTRSEKIQIDMDVAVVGVETHMTTHTLALIQKQLDRFLLVRIFDSELGWNSLALWSYTALRDKNVITDDLVSADAEFDRQMLSKDSGKGRLWVQGTDYGVRKRKPGEAVANFAACLGGTKLRLNVALKHMRGLIGRRKRIRENERLRRRFYQEPR